MSTEQAAAFTPLPDDANPLSPPAPAAKIPTPGGVAPTAKAVAPKAVRPGPTKRGPGRPKGSTKKRAAPRATPAEAADNLAAAAALALEKESRDPGRPTVKSRESEDIEKGLKNFYVGLGAMLVGAAVLFRPRRTADGMVSVHPVAERLTLAGTTMISQATDCAAALVAWSEGNAKVRAALRTVNTGGGLMLVLAAHAPIAAAAAGFTAPGGDADGLDLGALVGMLGGMGDLSDLLGGLNGAG